MNEVAPDSYWEQRPPESERPAPGSEVSLISTELMQSINPGFIILFTPLVVGFFHLAAGRAEEGPSTPAKISPGVLLITGLSAMVMVLAAGAAGSIGQGLDGMAGRHLRDHHRRRAVPEPHGSVAGLEAPPTRVTGLMMGGWFLSTAIGNKLAGMVGELWEQVESLKTIFWINALCAFAAALMIAVMVPWIKRVMAEHEKQVQARNDLAEKKSASS